MCENPAVRWQICECLTLLILLRLTTAAALAGGRAPFLEYARGGIGRASHVVVLEQSGLSCLCSAMGNVAGKVC